MIKIYHRVKDGRHRLEISGHAGYAPAGSDIVCAGASALACALVDYLHQYAEGTQVLRRESGEVLLTCPVSGRADTAIELALTGFSRIAEAYPRYAEVDRSENTPQWGEERKYL